MTNEPCTRCGLHFFFPDGRPDGWTCVYCAEEVPSSGFDPNSPVPVPVERCPYCVGGCIGADICQHCWGSADADV